LTDEPSRSATIKSVEYAKEHGKLISYDPNWRPPLWENDETAKKNMLSGVKYADILKVSFEELRLLTGQSDLVGGTSEIAAKGVKMVVVTLGAKGCFFNFMGESGYVNTYDTKVVDTTGAGDAFLGGLLYRIVNSGCQLEHISMEEVKDMMHFSNAAGAICASGYGAISSMPSLEEIRECMNKTPLLV